MVLEFFKMKRFLLTLLVGLIGYGSVLAQMLKAQDRKIVDDAGENILLRGMGLGGWALMEGYMMQTGDVANTQHEFRNKLVDLMGVEKTGEFFAAWRAKHCTEEDIDSLASWGFNSVRLPMHYNLFTLPIEDEPVAGEHTWLNPGFEMIDQLLEWCKPRDMYVILDLHAAPGGQGYDEAISDYDPSKPSLWESVDNRDKMVALWDTLSARYKDEPWIGGYDLLNEPNWNLPEGKLLADLYKEITQRVRENGDDHIIFVEGNWFANDYTGMLPPWDNNLVYSFHKYWTTNYENELDWILPMSEEHNVPLWMGESGENSNVWFRDAIKLFEDNNIGWAWWTMKKIETTTSPYSVSMNQGYRDIIEYWKGNAVKPSQEEAFASMMALTDNLLLENSFLHKDVVDAMFRQVQTDETKAFADHTIPGTINMSDFDLGRQGFAYYDKFEANYAQSTGEFTAWNNGWTYRNDAVDIEKNEIEGNGYHIGFVNQGEWINYTVNCSESGAYKVTARVATQQSGGLTHLSIDSNHASSVIEVSSTGGWTTFEDYVFENVIVEQGVRTLTFHVDGVKAFNISSLKFELTGTVDDVEFTVLGGSTNADETSITVVVNFDVDVQNLVFEDGDFVVKVNGVEAQVKSIKALEDNVRALELTLTAPVRSTDQITVSYNGAGIESTGGKPLTSFTDLLIVNNLPSRFVLPKRIEAESYNSQSGFSLEDSEDLGGGKNLAYTNVGDYADYLIIIDKEQEWQIDGRLASGKKEGLIGFYLVDDEGVEQEIAQLETPFTGGWQKWTTASTTTSVIPVGFHTLRMKVLETEFNLNWFQFKDVPEPLSTTQINEAAVYPNPSSGRINIDHISADEYELRTSAGISVRKGNVTPGVSLDFKSIPKGMYLLSLRTRHDGAVHTTKLIIK